MDLLKDTRVDCYSIMTTMSIARYLEIAGNAYARRGGIDNQREPLKTTTAQRIRTRMKADIQAGTVLPPVVIGVILPQEQLNSIQSFSTAEEIISAGGTDGISIIDGMQRTTALLEIFKEGHLVSQSMRVELWVASKTNSLVYRMLVLNTGQVPWNLRRQVEVVFDSIIKEISQSVSNVNLIRINDGSRRTRAGEFQADDIVELFLTFGARKEKIDTKERLADEFTRLDFIEATSDSIFSSLFYKTLWLMGALDAEFFGALPLSEESSRFRYGKDLFSSQPACVGLVTAVAQYLFGRPGASERSQAVQLAEWDRIEKNAISLIENLHAMSPDELTVFMDFSTLNEAISKKSGKVGDFEREFFLKAFQTLIDDNFEVGNLTSCWRAF